MKKLLICSIFLFLLFTPKVNAADNSFVSIINPIRGSDFWDTKDQKPSEAVLGQMQTLKQNNLPATWLVRFDALSNDQIISALKSKPSSHEIGLFLEITPSWTKASQVNYVNSTAWHNAGSVFLTGYSQKDREKLIDTSFEKFKNTFGFYPKSVGAWWVDSYSLDYMQKKYGVISALIVADQYSTDNYQIWGQYFSAPYYPQKRNALAPAQSEENKLPIVMIQWASRDPINGYGDRVADSTYSIQANDYLDYHNLNISYFSKLVDIYTTQQFNQVNHLTVGLENSYSWDKYKDEYQRQIQILNDKSKTGQFSLLTMSDFAKWYMQKFPKFSPPQTIVADDPLGSHKKVVWYMDPFYRAGWFNHEGSVMRDLRQYIDGSEEICYLSACTQINFATFATRVLDEVTYGNRWVIDEGSIRNFSFNKSGEDYILSYLNESGKIRKISFLPRDIKLDNNTYSIDGAILQAINNTSNNGPAHGQTNSKFILKDSLTVMLLRFLGFLVFLVLAIFIPGYVILSFTSVPKNLLFDISASAIFGLVNFTLFSYIGGFLKIWWFPLVFVFISLIYFFVKKFYQDFKKLKINTKNLPVVGMILAGVIFQLLPVFKSGLLFNQGVGFWGPNGHDGVWHLALINQLTQGFPIENPTLSGVPLQNYHYFFDLLVSATHLFTKIPVADLLFRFYPMVFSLLLGLGSLSLIQNIAQDKLSANKLKAVSLFSLYVIYFSGSFGWIVEFLRERHFGGESAFWANQSVSFNLNPPFALSLIIVIALFNLCFIKEKNWRKLLLVILLAGSLLEFKAYAGILVVGSLGIVAFINFFRKQFFYLWAFIGSSILTILVVLPNIIINKTISSVSGIFIFSPFWFIHSMVDAPDRVGWERLSLMRITGFEKKQWFKFLAAETVGLVLFIAGNLGMRVLSLALIFKAKKVVKSDALLFITIFTFLSILTPLLFIQQGNPWNTIQFLYYGMYVFGLLTGFSLFGIFNKFPKVIALPILLFLLAITPINSVITARGYLGNLPHAFISNKELEALNFLSKQPNGVVLADPFNKNNRKNLPEPFPLYAYETSAYISAFSNKPTFEADEIQNDILATYSDQGMTPYKKRLIATKGFFKDVYETSSSNTEGTTFLLNNKIKYIYLLRVFNQPLDENKLGLAKIFENNEVLLYKVK